MHGPIVVTVDGSPESEWVIPFAADLARRGQVELQLVHVHTLTTVLRRMRLDVCIGLAALEEAHTRLRALTRGVDSVSARGVLLEGDVVPVLLRYIESVRPAFVVIETSEPAELQGVFSGDVARSIVREAC